MNLKLHLALVAAILTAACDGRTDEAAAPASQTTPMIQADERAPDGPMDAEQQARANALTADQIEAIDRALVRASDAQWRKVARVVGTAMMSDWKGKPKGIADVYYSQRVAQLVQQGKLEAQGNLARMRFSEVRLR